MRGFTQGVDVQGMDGKTVVGRGFIQRVDVTIP